MQSETCEYCNRQIPESLINEFILDGEYLTACPLCAWRMVNALHGLGEQPFRGERARAQFDEAVEFVQRTKQRLSEAERRAYEAAESHQGASVRIIADGKQTVVQSAERAIDSLLNGGESDESNHPQGD